MASPLPFDPAGFFRDMLTEWEKMANSLGGDALKSEEFVRAMNGAQMAASAMQAQVRDHVDKAIGQTNLATRAQIDDVTLRLSAIEAALARIERQLGSAPVPATRPKPTRGRKAPAGAAD